MSPVHRSSCMRRMALWGHCPAQALTCHQHDIVLPAGRGRKAQGTQGSSAIHGPAPRTRMGAHWLKAASHPPTDRSVRSAGWHAPACTKVAAGTSRTPTNATSQPIRFATQSSRIHRQIVSIERKMTIRNNCRQAPTCRPPAHRWSRGRGTAGSTGPAGRGGQQARQALSHACVAGGGGAPGRAAPAHVPRVVWCPGVPCRQGDS